jgi:serine/threonine protein kinase
VTVRSAERIGSYEVLRLLGQGGMAEVFRVRAVEGKFAGREFALKRLLPEHQTDPESVELFKAEAEHTRALKHPNIVEVYEVGHDRRALFIVMELIDGRDVGQIIKRCRQTRVLWPLDFALYLTSVLLEALDCAHHLRDPQGAPLGIIHCDVSPSNFFVSRTGDLRLGDFGVARSFLEAGAESVLGKPYYLSPEALRGIITPDVDLWAVGVTLYELLTLQRPFHGKTPTEVYEKIRRGVYAPVRSLRPEVPGVVEGILARTFDPELDMRFRSAEEFAAEIRPFFDERIGTPLAISAVVRGLFGASDVHAPPQS